MITVLLIEDSSTDAALTMSCLENHCRFTHLKDIPATESDIVRDSYDLVISDLCLPSMEKENTVKKVKKLFPNTPLVILTGNSEEKLHRRCLASGAAAVHEKGTSSEESLLLSIHSALEVHFEEARKFQKVSISKVLSMMREVNNELTALVERPQT